MPRKLRVEYSGAIDHVMSRGDGKGDIFLDDVDRQDFLKTLAEKCLKTGFQVPAHCLMRNHFHLVVETPNANLAARLRRETTLTVRQIAERLEHGQWEELKQQAVFAQPRERRAQ